DPEIKKLFLRLAAEEAFHKAHFEKLYDEVVLTENWFIFFVPATGNRQNSVWNRKNVQ
ncbi:MAG: hypothetical protein KAS65_11850, partial [Candidatus Aminicenantes bacterium]|nr:hypothetical protein [Candidatus Aminicenantes bacterium]